MKRVTAICVLALVVCSCGGGGGGGSSAPPPPSSQPVSVAVSPTSASVSAGATQQFTATVQNTINQNVTWQVNRTTGGSSTVGTISSTGLYTAPLAPPTGGTVTVTAVSQADPNRIASASVTVVFSNASVNGRFAFRLSGVDSAGVFYAAGSFQADGNGNMSNGIEDLNHGTGVLPNLTFSGSYTVGADGRGQAVISGPQVSATLRFALISANEAVITEFDNIANASGRIEKQDTAAFNASTLNGAFIFAVDGVSSNGSVSAVGRIAANGAGSITTGVEDINDGGFVSTNVPLTGSYTVGANGRGTATLNVQGTTLQYAFHIVTSSRVLLLSLDFLPATIGAAEKQDSLNFSNSSLQGDFAFVGSGATVAGANAIVGRLNANGTGQLNGSLDENDTGIVAENVSFAGGYTVSSNGRTTFSVTSVAGTSNFSAFLITPDKAYFLQLDNFATTSGTAFKQQAGPFSTSTISGSFAFAFVGFDLITGGPIDIVGRAQANGSGQISGIEDVNQDAVLSSGINFSGSYSVAAPGRVTLQITNAAGTSNLRGYLVSPSRILLIGVDATELLIGVAGKQF